MRIVIFIYLLIVGDVYNMVGKRIKRNKLINMSVYFISNQFRRGKLGFVYICIGRV